MSSRNSRTMLFSLAIFAASAGHAAAQSLTNPDFETGDLTGWTVVNTANGVGAPGTVTVIDIDGPGPLDPSYAATFAVGQAVFTSGAQEGVELTQNVTLLANTTYTFEFDWSAQRISATNNAQGGVFTIILDGQELAQAAAGTTSSAAPQYGHLSTEFTVAAAGTYTLGVRITRPFTSPGDLFQYVDNFVLGGGGPTPCYPNCDGSTTEPILNVADFSCFLAKFAAGDPYANCDGSTTEPVLNVADFSCFLAKFAAGCR
jgi:hypothetical protein